MPNFHPHLVAVVADRLEPGEEVWAVYPSTRRPLVVTARRLFLLGPGGPDEHPLEEFTAVRRARETLVVLERGEAPSLGIPVDPADEHGLQALTVIGLLVAAKGDPEARIPDAVPEATNPGRSRGDTVARRRQRAWHLQMGR